MFSPVNGVEIHAMPKNGRFVSPRKPLPPVLAGHNNPKKRIRTVYAWDKRLGTVYVWEGESRLLRGGSRGDGGFRALILLVG